MAPGSKVYAPHGPSPGVEAGQCTCTALMAVQAWTYFCWHEMPGSDWACSSLQYFWFHHQPETLSNLQAVRQQKKTILLVSHAQETGVALDEAAKEDLITLPVGDGTEYLAWALRVGSRARISC